MGPEEEGVLRESTFVEQRGSWDPGGEGVSGMRGGSRSQPTEAWQSGAKDLCPYSKEQREAISGL